MLSRSSVCWGRGNLPETANRPEITSADATENPPNDDHAALRPIRGFSPHNKLLAILITFCSHNLDLTPVLVVQRCLVAATENAASSHILCADHQTT